MSVKDPNVVYVGNKPVMSYVFAVMTSLGMSNSKDVKLKARGRAITTAVDVAEITRKKFADKVKLKDVQIGTEELPREEGGTRAVSIIEITLSMD